MMRKRRGASFARRVPAFQTDGHRNLVLLGHVLHLAEPLLELIHLLLVGGLGELLLQIDGFKHGCLP